MLYSLHITSDSEQKANENMTKTHKYILLLAAIAATSICILPLLSTHFSTSETCTMTVRGYNLPAFSAWGCVPLLTPALFVAILFSHQSKAAKEIETLLLLTATMICFTHAFNAARAWLDTLDGLPITYHFGIFIFPLTGIAILLLAKAFDSINN